MKRIGITGKNGFIGWHLYHTLNLQPGNYQLVSFERNFFDNEDLMDSFVRQCDVIVHLAGLNRHHDENEIYQKNITLVEKLAASLERTGRKPHVLMASSTQEDRDNPYGRSKKAAREKLVTWAHQANAPFTGLLLPNIFGPFGHPFYNSFVATFCHQLANGEEPEVQVDAEVSLLYVGDAVDRIIDAIDTSLSDDKWLVPADEKQQVSVILQKLKGYRDSYFDQGVIPQLYDAFDIKLFNTFRSYFKHEKLYPRHFKLNTDERGSFVELIRLGIGGQVSYSTTKPGITRGNHFHTRKIERFAVIKGKALIQLRRIGTDDVLSFELDGQRPSYVDMPVWYTHNIRNTGDDELYTVFWINEFYDPQDPDTYLEEV